MPSYKEDVSLTSLSVPQLNLGLGSRPSHLPQNSFNYHPFYWLLSPQTFDIIRSSLGYKQANLFFPFKLQPTSLSFPFWSNCDLVPHIPPPTYSPSICSSVLYHLASASTISLKLFLPRSLSSGSHYRRQQQYYGSFVFAHPPPPTHTHIHSILPHPWSLMCVGFLIELPGFLLFSCLRNVGGLALELTSPRATLGQQLRDGGVGKAQFPRFLTNLRHSSTSRAPLW